MNNATTTQDDRLRETQMELRAYKRRARLFEAERDTARSRAERNMESLQDRNKEIDELKSELATLRNTLRDLSM